MMRWNHVTAARHKVASAMITLGLSLAPLAAIVTADRATADHEPLEAATPEETAALQELAALIQATHQVFASHQDLVNNPSPGPKHLTGSRIVEEALSTMAATQGKDRVVGPMTLDLAQSIRRTADDLQSTIERPNVGFKGLVPALFMRLAVEDFNRRMDGRARIKITAPPEIVRNVRAMPDDHERHVIAEEFQKHRSREPISGVVSDGTLQHVRFLMPVYYDATCLECHGTPKGALDVTRYPMEGKALGDLGGVISITMLREAVRP